MTFKQYFLEKWLLGLVEFIEIDGLGKIAAKLDSGNGAHNVLHATDIQIQGSKVIFKTINNKRLVKDLADKVLINVKSGIPEDERPVVNFNVRIGERDFPNIPFSITDRTENLYKVLIGKEFIEKNLNGIIDVSQEDIADLNKEVDIDVI
jgi:hypothetical protein